MPEPIENKDLGKSNNLFDKIVSEQNIYNAIYSLESYVFEKGLLDTQHAVKATDGEIIAHNDLELYHALGDKFDMPLIEKVIDVCKQRLESLLTKEDDLFDISVYFKLKGIDDVEEGKDKTLKFRPLHTARLTDMICMVSMLMCLMFDDSEDGRKLSDLSKLIPHNFYGNVPSTDVKYLFKRWQTQYKEYTRNIIEHCRTYQNTHRFLTEVSLDIKNFFPSVSPQFLYNYILEKLSAAYQDKTDQKVLKTAVAKLLYFKISAENIEPWLDRYYDNTPNLRAIDGNCYMNCGIPQGLPQSYFFGNLCMIEVKKLLMKKDIFEGDAYFYVDDSVIYVQSKMDTDDFSKKVEDLNESLKEFCDKSKRGENNPAEVVDKKFVDFHEHLAYTIQFHEDGKSSFCHIDDADNHLDGFNNLDRLTSNYSNLYENLEDIDDTISCKKLSVVNEVVEREISNLKEKENGDKKDLKNKEASRLKMLKRFKKYFLYRVRLLKLKTGEESLEKLWDNFKVDFLAQKDVEAWFEKNEEEIFQSEYRLLIQKSSMDACTDLENKIRDFEQSTVSNLTKKAELAASDYLYFKKDVASSILMKGYATDGYASLRRWIKQNYCEIEGTPQRCQFEKFTHFLSHEYKIIREKGFSEKACTRFITKHSSDYQRRILNAYYSALVGVICSDSCSFVKSNSRKMNYTELRVLIRLRNRLFDLKAFEAFVKKLEDKDVSNQMGIDMALLSVIGTFERFVRNPEWIDGLILTHRITKGLWYNGSKFLNSYTLHNEEHAVTLINQAVHIVKTIDYFAIKSVDYYILFLACYLHDISMVIHPDLYELGSCKGDSLRFVSEQMLKMHEAVEKFFKVDDTDTKNGRMKEGGSFLVKVFEAVYGYFENKVRTQHPQDSAVFIIAKADTLLRYLEPTLLSFVSEVSASHGVDVMDVYGLKSHAKDDTVSKKYLMILIRLADLFDVANDRVNYHLLRQNLNFLSKISRFHWISHLVTDKLELDADYQHDENAGLREKPITETLIVTLFLNVKNITAYKRNVRCVNCQSRLGKGYIDVDIVGIPKYECTPEKNECILLCRWMMEKHAYLIPELKALNDYLFSVNNTLIKTTIKLRIKYNDAITLDADLFDSVVDYLQEQDEKNDRQQA